MPDAAESKPPVDLSDLRLMPQWVAEFGTAQPRLESDDSDSRPRDRRDGGDRRSGGGGGDRGDRRGPPRRDGNRPPFGRPNEKPAGRRDDRDRGPRGEHRGDQRDDRRGGGGGNFRSRDDRGQGPRYEPPPTVQGLIAQIEPDQHAMEAMAHMIRSAGKAYSVFDAARLVLASGDRFHVRFGIPPEAPAKLVHIAGDGSLWLNRDEAVAHMFRSDLLDHFYRTERIELEEPKGNFTSVAVCGMSGELLGPPNHHSYQTTLHKLHRERFSHMAFEDYKRRVRTDNGPEAVQKWKDSQRHGIHWVDIVTPPPEGGEPERLKSRAEMESHFRKHHAEGLLKECVEAVVAGNIVKKNLSPSLYHALRQAVDEARKHLLQTAQQLCIGFEKLGLKLFKRRGGKLWVSRNRPRVLDGNVVLSDRIARIVQVIKSKAGINLKELIETVAPSPPRGAEALEPAAVPEPRVAEAPQTPQPAPAVQDESPLSEAAATEAISPGANEAPASGKEISETAPASEPPPVASAIPPPPPVPHHEMTSEQLQVLKDLHWLNSEGYIIEFADGVIFVGVNEPPQAKPKPAKEPVKREPAKAETPAAETLASPEPQPASPEAEPVAASVEATAGSEPEEEEATAVAAEVHAEVLPEAHIPAAVEESPTTELAPAAAKEEAKPLD